VDRTVRTWTEPELGVLYKYTEYQLYFQGCDFWRQMGTCVAPASKVASGGASEVAAATSTTSGAVKPSTTATPTDGSNEPTAFDPERELKTKLVSNAPPACQKYARLKCNHAVADQKRACDRTIESLNDIAADPRAPQKCAHWVASYVP
jgi:hypothetical protein